MTRLYVDYSWVDGSLFEYSVIIQNSQICQSGMIARINLVMSCMPYSQSISQAVVNQATHQVGLYVSHQSIHSFIHALIYSFIYSFIYSIIY